MINLTNRRILYWAVIFTSLSAAPRARADYPTAVLNDSPVAYWRFEDGNVGDVMSNLETATDSAGNHHGVYLAAGFSDGPQLVATAPGLGSTAVHFFKDTAAGGVGEYILFDELADVGSNIDNNGLTFEFLFKNLQGNTTFNRLFGVWNQRPGGAFKTQLSFSLHRPTNKQELFLRDDANVLQEFEFGNSVADINDGEWHHVAWVILPGVTSNGMRAYVDGQSMPMDAVTNSAPSMFANFDKAFMIGGEHAVNFNPTNFTLNAIVDEFAVYSAALSQSQIQSHVQELVANRLEWEPDHTASWHSLLNWSELDGILPSIPNSSSATAVFGNAITGPTTVIVDQAVTAKAVEFDNGHSYAIAGNGSITLESNASNASVDVFSGTHQFQVEVNLNSNTEFDINNGAQLKLNNRLTLNGHDLTKSGQGTLSINNEIITGGGTLSLSSGAMSGNATIFGNLVNDGAIVSPGNSPGAIHVTGDYHQGANGTLLLEIAGTSPGIDHDLLEVGGLASFAGTLSVLLTNDYHPSAGDIFEIFRFQEVLAEFDRIELPQLTHNLSWDSSDLYSYGQLRVAQVPEPSLLACACIVCAILLIVRKRRNLAGGCGRFTRCRYRYSATGIVAVIVLFPSTIYADYASAVLSDNPVAYWRFEDGDQGDVLNGAVAIDEKGSHPGTYTAQGSDGPELVAGPPGVGGTAARFVSSDYILFDSLGDVGGNIDDNGLTFEFFLKNQQLNMSAENRLFGVWNDRPGGARKTQLSFGFNDGGGRDSIFLRNDSDQAVRYPIDDPANTDIKTGIWNHVAWVIEPGVPENGLKVYVNGVQLTLIPEAGELAPKALSGFANFDKEFALGVEHNNTGGLSFFTIDSVVDEFAIYSAALTQTQIQSHLAEIVAGPAHVFEWNRDTFGDWDGTGNWQAKSFFESGMPNGNNMTAIFGNNVTASRTIVTESEITLKAMRFDNSTHSFAIAGQGSITMSADVGSASVEVLSGNHEIQAIVGFATNADVTVAANSKLELDNQLNLNGKVVTKSGAGTLLINNTQIGSAGNVIVTNGILGGAGRVPGNVTNQSGGTVAPGASAGVLTIGGTYTQNIGSTLSIELAGLVKGEEYDVLNVVDAIVLNGGTLALSLANFTPEAGDTFDILDFSSTSGSFSAMSLPGGLSAWNVSQLYSTGTLTFIGGGALAGDYNGDSTVNAADYVVWRNMDGQTGAGLAADGNGDEVVNHLDYNLWRQNFGNSAGDGAMLPPHAIPEPMTLLLLLMAVALHCSAALRFFRYSMG